MTAAILALKLVPLLLIGGLAPGLLVIKQLRWSPPEKLCGAMAASFILTYLASFILFICSAGTWAYWLTTAIFICMGASGASQLRLFLHNHQTRKVLIAFAIILAWDFLHLAMVRNYGGGTWYGDWREHYDRTRFFLHLLPTDFQYLDSYLLPARPPMMNLICAFFCRQAGINFEAYSLCCVFLNAFAFLPCCLLLGHLRKRGASSFPVLLVLFMLNPSIMQNVTWTITKAFSAGFVILGVAFYLRGLRSCRNSRFLAAALSFAAGILVHYSAIPFAVAVSLHAIWTAAFSRQRNLRLVAPACAAALLLSTWFAWSIHIFGFRATFFSNTTATGTSAKNGTENLAKIGQNLLTSIVPHPLLPFANGRVPPLENLGIVRDYFFLMYQTTLPMMIGGAGGIIAIYLLYTRLSRRSPDRNFWVFYVAFTFVLGIAVNPEREPFGCAHVTLQSLALMGVTLVAAYLTSLPTPLFNFAIVGLAVDYILGILLHFERQSHIFPLIPDPQLGKRFVMDPALGSQAFLEFYAKLSQGYVFWGDHLAPISPLLLVSAPLMAAIALFYLLHKRAEAIGRRSIAKVTIGATPP